MNDKECLECGGEAYYVDNGREVGQYYWCPDCKKEEAEWRQASAPDVPAPTPQFAFPAPWKQLSFNLTPPAAGDCLLCGAGAGEWCATTCPNHGN